MKSTLLFFMLFAFSLPAFANNSSVVKSEERVNIQEAFKDSKLSLDASDMSFVDILSQIRKLTGVGFIIEENINPKDMGLFSIEVKDATIEQTLEELLSGTKYGYEVTESEIIIKELPRDSRKMQEEEDKTKTVTGRILDTDKNPLAGAMILSLATQNGAISDAEGNFAISVENGDDIEITFLGFKTKTIRIKRETSNLLVVLEIDAEDVGDVTVVGFGEQKTESLVSSVTTVRAKDLKSSSSDLTTQFAGKIAGMIGWQTGGIPGALTEGEMNTKFYIRGITSFQQGANIDPLILIDGVESSKLDLARLNPDDIDSFSVLKDATATAMYGARGANGVILVETKKGTEGEVYTSAYYEVVSSSATSDIDVVDPLTYMTKYNEALLNNDPTASPKYSVEDIARRSYSNYPSYVYPNNDWYDIMFKDMSVNHRMGVSIRGGSRILQYFASVSHNRDQGMLKTDQLNQFDVNISNNTTSFRANLNIQLKAGISLNINTSANIDKYHGPSQDVTQAYGLAFQASPVDFAYMYPQETVNDGVYMWDHLRFGGSDDSGTNPYMLIHSGYTTRSRFSGVNRVEYIQDLDQITKGLEFRASVSFSNEAYYTKAYVTTPAQYALQEYDLETGVPTLRPLTDGSSAALAMDQNNTGSSVSDRVQYEARLYHVAAWDKHQTSVTVVGQAQTEDNSSAGSVVVDNFERRNMGLSMRGTYGYKDRYFFEGSFGYNGSERFSSENKMGFFPAGGFAWLVSKEEWMQGVSSWLSFLKLRASYGFVGNDGVVSSPRFIYLSYIGTPQLQDPVIGGTSFTGYDISTYANPNLGWEIAETLNLGMDVKLFNGDIEFTLEAYRSIRHNILDYRITIPAHVGIGSAQLDNVGTSLSQGFDLSLKYQKQFSSDLWMILNATATYSTARYEEILEASNKPEWQKKQGQEISQQIGYIAEGLFRDQAEIDNSPTQPGNPQPGDIRYRDINGDGLIDIEDATYIGYPETPRLVYGINGNITYKSFEFNFAFQGSGQRSFFVNPSSITPFLDGRALLTAINDSHWSETNMSSNPFWPRLTTTSVLDSNILEDWYGGGGDVRKSTYFMDEVEFLRCTSLELGYYLPKNITNKLKLRTVKVYARANNPFLISTFDIWDVELGESGFNYPIQKTYSVGVNLSF